MEKSDLAALDYKFKHARSKRKVIDEYPELRKKSVSQIKGILMVNMMIKTGLDMEKRKRLRKLAAKIIRGNKYERR